MPPLVIVCRWVQGRSWGKSSHRINRILEAAAGEAEEEAAAAAAAAVAVAAAAAEEAAAAAAKTQPQLPLMPWSLPRARHQLQPCHE